MKLLVLALMSSLLQPAEFRLRSVQALEAEGPVLEDLLTNRELRTYHQRTRYRDRMDLYRRVFGRFGDSFVEQWRRGDYGPAIKMLKEIRHLADFARAEPTGPNHERELRTNQVKRLEIRLRRMIEKLNDFKRTATLEQEPEFDEALESLEELRRLMLENIFGDGLLSDAGVLLDLPLVWRFSRPMSAVSSLAASAQARFQTQDRFTEDEFEELQLNQELVKRVDTFLKIAERRLLEIKNRMEEVLIKEDQVNPLEFFTYSDLIVAYDRAIEGIMINIDEKAKYKLASERDIRRALTRLNKQITDFIPRLSEIDRFAQEIKDPDLLREVRKAQETSDVALKGSLYGLGAPAK